MSGPPWPVNGLPSVMFSKFDRRKSPAARPFFAVAASAWSLGGWRLGAETKLQAPFFV
jgi:hypothetical protein